MKFQTSMRFSCEHNLPETKWISADWLNVAFNAFNAFKTQCGHGFHITNFERNEVLFRVIKYHVITNRNEMPTHVHRNIDLFWNAAGMKLHVNRTCFHTGSKSETGISSFRLSCKRTLIAKRCAGTKLGLKYHWSSIGGIVYWWNDNIKSYLSSHVSEIIAPQRRLMKIIKENHIYRVIAPHHNHQHRQYHLFLYSSIAASTVREDK